MANIEKAGVRLYTWTTAVLLQPISSMIRFIALYACLFENRNYHSLRHVMLPHFLKQRRRLITNKHHYHTSAIMPSRLSALSSNADLANFILTNNSICHKKSPM
ncbi:hypothetical protein ACRALDRAFT_2020767 [Sodiomyces alcalophilus JCM 7366]|uniref:uncharacterized protein n=1 Tax=Sodiomyces alcalophilus JCM 7366 TaxID=591952 RepID=UPI0039B475F2